jgi:hypothetical protein
VTILPPASGRGRVPSQALGGSGEAPEASRCLLGSKSGPRNFGSANLRQRRFQAIAAGERAEPDAAERRREDLPGSWIASTGESCRDRSGPVQLERPSMGRAGAVRLGIATYAAPAMNETGHWLASGLARKPEPSAGRIRP